MAQTSISMTIVYRKEVAVAIRIVFILAITLSLVAGLSLSHPAQVLVPSWAQENKPLKVALLTDALFSDGGWGAVAYNASQVLKDKYGLELTTQEKIAIPDIEPTLRDAAEAGNDLIIAHGFEWGDPTLKVAQDYPNTKFVVFTGLTNSTNVASIFPMQQEGSFLLGALAGLMTKTNSLGCVGGKAYPNIINIFEGFKQGAKMVNPNVKITCVFIDDFQNPAKGKEAGLNLVNNGADFLIHVADLSGQGVIQAADEKGVYAFGVVADQNYLAPNTVLSSFVIDMEKALGEAIEMVQNGNFSGQTYKPGLETAKGGPGPGIVYLASFHNLDSKVPADVKSKLAQLTQDVLNKNIPGGIPERSEESP
jgi:basic membrane protein A